MFILLIKNVVLVSTLIASTGTKLDAISSYQGSDPDLFVLFGPTTVGEQSNRAKPSNSEICRALATSVEFERYSLTSDQLRLIAFKGKRTVDPIKETPLIGRARLHHQLYFGVVISSDRIVPLVRIIKLDYRHFEMIEDSR